MVVTLALAALIAPQAASAQGSERSGKQVVESACASCHATGEKGAPKIGNKQAWSKLSERGLGSLTESALKGIRQILPMALWAVGLKKPEALWAMLFNRKAKGAFMLTLTVYSSTTVADSTSGA